MKKGQQYLSSKLGFNLMGLRSEVKYPTKMAENKINSE